MKTASFLAWLIGAAIIVGTSFFFFPKWKQPRLEATISWDVSGYYTYLPALFIYHDLKNLAFGPKIVEQYYPAPELASLDHWNHHKILKYPAGQALQFLPWFAAGHLAAKLGGYPMDGFSYPYQAAISWGSLLVALLGLWFLRRLLLRYFEDKTVAVTLLLLVLGTNYLDYTAINGAMTHNWLFTLYALLLWSTIRFYERPSFQWAAAIGILVGWAALTRPTDIVAAVIPLIWGIGSRTNLRERSSFLWHHRPKVVLAGLLAFIMGFIQLAYWKFVGEEWLIYSYEDQSFNWLKPHLTDGLFSYQSGWLVYSPILVLALAGFGPLYRHYRSLFWTSFLFGLLYIYITFAWDIWWYGGSLGQRAMIQSYPIFALPLAAFVQWVLRQKVVVQIPVLLLGGVFVCYNLWLTRHAHGDGLLRVGEMNQAYFWKILGKDQVPEQTIFLLDQTDDYTGPALSSKVLYINEFEEEEGGGN